MVIVPSGEKARQLSMAHSPSTERIGRLRKRKSWSAQGAVQRHVDQVDNHNGTTLLLAMIGTLNELHKLSTRVELPRGSRMRINHGGLPQVCISRLQVSRADGWHVWQVL
jgi:hypothetical protein